MENIKETFQTTSAGKVKFVRIFVFVVAGMAGLLFGLDQGVTDKQTSGMGCKLHDGRCSCRCNRGFAIILRYRS